MEKKTVEDKAKELFPFSIHDGQEDRKSAQRLRCAFLDGYDFRADQVRELKTLLGEERQISEAYHKQLELAEKTIAKLKKQLTDK